MIQAGRTALILASMYGRLSEVQYLVQQGAVIDTQDKVRNHNNYYLLL